MHEFPMSTGGLRPRHPHQRPENGASSEGVAHWHLPEHGRSAGGAVWPRFAHRSGRPGLARARSLHPQQRAWCRRLFRRAAHRGFFPVAWLDDYCKNGSKLAGHVVRRGVPGVELATGSLGHGLRSAAAWRWRLANSAPAIALLFCSPTANAMKAPSGRRPCSRGIIILIAWSRSSTTTRSRASVPSRMCSTSPLRRQMAARFAGPCAKSMATITPQCEKALSEIPADSGQTDRGHRSHHQGQGGALHGRQTALALSVAGRRSVGRRLGRSGRCLREDRVHRNPVRAGGRRSAHLAGHGRSGLLSAGTLSRKISGPLYQRRRRRAEHDGSCRGTGPGGRIPFTYSIANFPTLRCLEQIRNDICHHQLPVRIVVRWAAGSLMVRQATPIMASKTGGDARP